MCIVQTINYKKCHVKLEYGSYLQNIIFKSHFDLTQWFSLGW